VNPYEGFSWKNAVGPLAGVLENYVGAGQELSRGNLDKAVEKSLPSGLRNAAKLYLDDGAYRDANENLIFEPSQTERVMGAIGFKPKKLTQYYEQQAILRRAEEIEAYDMQEFHQGLAQQLLAGNNQAVQSALLERQQTSRGTYDIQAGLKRVVELAQAYVTPKDPVRSSSRAAAQSAQQVGMMYGRAEQPSEAESLQRRKRLESQILPGAGRMTPAEYRTATLVDQLLAANPSLTRTQALMMVERMTKPQSTYRRYGSGTGF
jgi:hypothetical protein